MTKFDSPYIDPEEMRLGEHKAGFVIRVGHEWTPFYRGAAKAKHKDTGSQWGSVERWFAGMITEAAFYVHLKEQEKWKSWWGTVFFGEAKEAGHDFITSCEGRLETIGIRGRKHEEVIWFAEHDEPVFIFYPAREIVAPRFIIATTYKRVPEGEGQESTWVAFWGALRGERISDYVVDNSLPNNPGRDIPLTDFRSDLLDEIIQTRDSEQPEVFRKLLMTWGQAQAS